MLTKMDIIEIPNYDIEIKKIKEILSNKLDYFDHYDGYKDI